MSVSKESPLHKDPGEISLLTRPPHPLLSHIAAGRNRHTSLDPTVRGHLEGCVWSLLNFAHAPFFSPWWFLKLNVLEWHWLITLYVSVYLSVMHHLCVAQCTRHPKSSLPPPPCIWLPLSPLHPSSPPAPLVKALLLSVSDSVLCIHVLLSVLYPASEWNHMALVLHLTYFS